MENKNNKKFNTGDKVKIISILNTEEADHLQTFIGETGVIVSWINYNGYRYKVKIEGTEDTYYFWESELELKEKGVETYVKGN
jgi:ribosomal protein L21E